jgi:hypothetical protein
LLSGVAVIDLQDLIANLSEDNISKKNEHVALLLLYIDQGTLAHSTRRLPHSGAVATAPRSQWASSSACHLGLHDRQAIEAIEAKKRRIRPWGQHRN